MNTKTTTAKAAKPALSASDNEDIATFNDSKAVLRLKERLNQEKKRADLHFENWKRVVDERHDVQQSFDIARGKWEAEKLQLTSQVGGMKEALKIEREDTNRLRSQVFDLHLSQARLNGYIDGVEESLPPRMVEERRSLRRMETSTPEFDPFASSDGYRHRDAPKPFWFVK